MSFVESVCCTCEHMCTEGDNSVCWPIRKSAFARVTVDKMIIRFVNGVIARGDEYGLPKISERPYGFGELEEARSIGKYQSKPIWQAVSERAERYSDRCT